jgi:protein TonB
MFEDSTFESTGSIRTHSRTWMLAAFSFNGSILLALVLIPLMYPQALGRQMMPVLMTVPPPPLEQKPPEPQPTRVVRTAPMVVDGHVMAPRQIPTSILVPNEPEPPTLTASLIGMEPAVPGAIGIGPRGPALPRVVHAPVGGPVRVSSMVVAGLILQKTMPTYPPMGKAMHLEGTVELAATISKAGSIENLRVVSGPALLQQAALDAVKTWRYRPYLLNGEPVEVETTVNVVFALTR